MVRKMLLLVAVLAAAFAAIPVAAARPATPVTAVLQTDDEEAVAPDVVELDLGERFASDAYALEVQDVHIVPSIARPDYLDVRVAVAFQNRGATPLPMSPVALSGEPGFPSLQLVDDEGVVHELDRSNPYRMAVPATSTASILPGLPAHWTLGFEASSEQGDELRLQAVDGGFVVAEWDLLSDPLPLAGWDAPEGAEEAGLGDDIEWDDALTLRFSLQGTVACGLADLVHSATTTIVEFSIENDDVVERPFPAVRYPDVPMIAVWADGTTARHVETAGFITQPTSDIVNYDEFAAELTEDEKAVVTTEVMRSRPSVEFNMVPPAVQDARVQSLFVAARDSRMANVLDSPVALYLMPPGGDPVWLDITNSVNVFDNEAEAENPSCGVATPSVELGTRAEQMQLLELREPAPEVEETTDNSLTGN